MSVKLGVVMDPISLINIKKDSSFAMLLAAQSKGWELYYMEQTDLYLDQESACATMKKLTVQRNPLEWFTFGEEMDQALATLDTIIMRKDPPFDSEFLYATHLLERAEKEGVLVVNRAQSLRDCNEKLYATQFPECCPPVLVTRKARKLRSFLEQHKDVIFKPLDGMGGSSIFRVKEGDANVGVIIETLTQHGSRQTMAQKYLPEIKDGDKRILIINGVPVDYALARIPSVGENRGNLAAGGTGEARPLTERDRWIVNQIKEDLIARGLMFVGIDVIGDYLTEINVTSPTCIQEIDQAFGTDIAGELMNQIEKELSKRTLSH